VLKVVATDPGSVRDFQAFARQTGNQLLSNTELQGEYLFLMRKK
jgi:tRNA 2-thiouridine synthesizing protein A